MSIYNLMKNFNNKILNEIINLIQQSKENFFFYVSNGILNTEGKKLQILIIRKYSVLFKDKKYWIYIRKNKEEDFLRMLNYMEKDIENYLQQIK